MENIELKNLKGVGPSTLKKLENLNIFDINDLLYFFPRKYIDRRRNLKIIDLKLIENEEYHCIATISNLKLIRLRGKYLICNAKLTDDTGSLAVTWFNNPYITSQFSENDNVVFSGKLEKGKIINPKIKKISSEDDISKFARIETIYPETRGLKSYQLNNFLRQITLNPEFNIKENLPKKILKAEKLILRKEALVKIHFPQNDDDIEKSRKRFGFEEIYKIIQKVQKRKQKLKKFNSPEIKINPTTHKIFIEKLPYQLTPTQEIAISEIFNDITKSNPMHRLLNGDVGSGKTIVALSAIWQVINNNKQAIFLAPTSVLAHQHYLELLKYFDDKEKIHFITSQTRNEKTKLEKLLSNSISKNQIFIGTHALLHRLEIFENVGLLIIDEQHKFGVEQRETLENLTDQNLNLIPHLLSMSATPIPRSFALTLFGDIEVSLIDKPPTRKKIITKIINEEELIHKMYEWIRKSIKEDKSQVYVVCPLIEESEVLTTKAVKKEFENLKEIFPEFNIEILHGKIKPNEKNEILQRFKDGKINILVSTSVIEVGVDSPNANIMIIEGAERFGLAQLHQIRGRVGRGENQSYCFLKTTDNLINKRLEFFSENQDGLKISEYDLMSRGPGEVYGVAQSGMPELRIGNIFDLELIKRVKKYFQ